MSLLLCLLQFSTFQLGWGAPEVSEVSEVADPTVAGRNEFPWMAALYAYGYFGCGGSLISNTWVLTAAHCACYESICPLNLWDMKAYFGMHHLETFDQQVVEKSLSQVVIHPSYTPADRRNDIALLRLTQPLNYNAAPHIRPICLPPLNSGLLTGKSALVAGWGQKHEYGLVSQVLMKANVNIVDCIQSYIPHDITETMICAAGEGYSKGACKGDSGGPLMMKGAGDFFTLIGAVSGGRYNCTYEHSPGIYTSISRMMGWIKQMTQLDESSCKRKN